MLYSMEIANTMCCLSVSVLSWCMLHPYVCSGSFACVWVVGAGSLVVSCIGTRPRTCVVSSASNLSMLSIESSSCETKYTHTYIYIYIYIYIRTPC